MLKVPLPISESLINSQGLDDENGPEVESCPFVAGVQGTCTELRPKSPGPVETLPFPTGRTQRPWLAEPTRPVVSPFQPATSRQVDLEEVKSSVTPPEYW